MSEDSHSEIETELKLALATAEDYDKVRDRLPGFQDEIEQENRYYDVPSGALRAKEVLWRLRHTASGYTLTVKRKATRRADGLFQAVELEEPLSDSLGHEIYEDPTRWGSVDNDIVAELREEFGPLDGVDTWGQMANRRRRYRLQDDVLVELDRTEFGPGDVEWEIEVEHTDPDRVRSLLGPHLEGIHFQPQTRTKSERLHARIDTAEAGE